MKPLKLPVLPKENVRLFNSIIGKRRVERFLLAGKAGTFSFCPSLDYFVPKVAYNLKLTDHDLCIVLDQVLPLDFFSEKLAGIDPERCPSPLRPALYESAWTDLLKGVEEYFGSALSITDCRFDNFPESSPDRQGEFAFSLKLNEGQRVLHGKVFVDLAGAELISALFERIDTDDADLAIWPSLTFPVSFVLGRNSIPIGQLREIEKGDILLLEESGIFKDSVCQVDIAGRFTFQGKHTGKQLTLFGTMEENLSDETIPETPEKAIQDEGTAEFKPDTASEDADFSIPSQYENLPLELSFEVGRRRISLKELSQLQEGYTFELDSPLEAPVSIRAGGRVIGKGELLNIADQRVGVRVTDFTTKL